MVFLFGTTLRSSDVRMIGVGVGHGVSVSVGSGAGAGGDYVVDCRNRGLCKGLISVQKNPKYSD